MQIGVCINTTLISLSMFHLFNLIRSFCSFLGDSLPYNENSDSVSNTIPPTAD